MTKSFVVETGKTFNVVIDQNRGENDKAYIHDLSDDELMTLSYDDLDKSQAWLWDDYIGETILRRIWNTERQRDELKQRWRDLKSSQNAKRAERQAELRKQGKVAVVRL